MPGTQELNRRIKSVKSTRKITRAMQMVSAAKMRKAQSLTLASRTYAELAWDLIAKLSAFKPEESDLEQGTTPWMLMQPSTNGTKIAVVFISTNRGFVGSFNTNVLNQLRQVEAEHGGKEVELIVMGRKVAEGLARQKKNIVADFPKNESAITVEGVYPIAQKLSSMYASGLYTAIYVAYTKFVSTLSQKATMKQLLPLGASMSNTGSTGGNTMQTNFEFEPTPEAVVTHLLPRILESQLYQAILESDASEHSARMVAMKSATDAAGDLISDLTLTYNQLRQNKITTELSEITAGKIALEK